jgi:hypothetical protein
MLPLVLYSIRFSSFSLCFCFFARLATEGRSLLEEERKKFSLVEEGGEA